MAISTYKTFLMINKGTSALPSWDKLICIKDFSDLGGTPEMIDVTTLCDNVRKNIAGVQEMDALTFTANYTGEAYEAIKAYTDKAYEFAVWFGGTGEGSTLTPTGSDGKFSFEGELTVWVNGGAVNEAVEMTLSIACSSAIEFELPSE